MKRDKKNFNEGYFLREIRWIIQKALKFVHDC